MNPVSSSATPRVTIVMPSYNHAGYIEQAIRSVLDQDYPDIELIVIDDCSTDSSQETIAALQRELGFRYVQHEQNCGLNPTLMEGYRTGTGKYTTMLASDDALLPGKLRKQVAYLEQTGKDGVYANGLKLWDDGRTEAIDLEPVARRFREGTMRDYAYVNDVQAPLFQSGLFLRTAILDLFSYRTRYKSDDWIILIRLLEDYDVGFINEPMFLYRQHGSNSFRRYWDMFPARIDIAATAIPDDFRAESLSNIMYSQAQYLLVDGRYLMGGKMLLAAFALKPRLSMISQTTGAALRRVFCSKKKAN
ncbi:glycosyltransferase family 2 protein [uncultured Sphingomonas sp.]|uniref:glycosyltransferase family 2 protein n=1 Tax=uncultured Sphingomonas sp. TaxID=158754 RepID=UPI0025D4050C|nr:glycosyltransferase family 2 protein [uncultured Sphingomonas sp.]